eukprot:516027-Pyramimonas_sp.AAC.1
MHTDHITWYFDSQHDVYILRDYWGPGGPPPGGRSGVGAGGCGAALRGGDIRPPRTLRRHPARGTQRRRLHQDRHHGQARGQEHRCALRSPRRTVSQVPRTVQIANHYVIWVTSNGERPQATTLLGALPTGTLLPLSHEH